MTGLNRQRSAMQMQGRKRGICRKSSTGLGASKSQELNAKKAFGGPGFRQGMQSNMPPNESIKMLKEQAEKLAKALKETEDQIKVFQLNKSDEEVVRE